MRSLGLPADRIRAMGGREHDRAMMERALREARRSVRAGEVPVGAVAVLDGEVLAAAHNRSVGAADPTAHAEVLALRRAARKLGSHEVLDFVGELSARFLVGLTAV